MKRLLLATILGISLFFATPSLGFLNVEVPDPSCYCDPDYPNHQYLHENNIPHNHCERVICQRNGEERVFTYAPKIAPTCPEFLVDFETGEWECK